MFVLIVGVTVTLIGIAIVIVASASVARHDEQVAIDLVLRALIQVSSLSTECCTPTGIDGSGSKSHLDCDHQSNSVDEMWN
jgi:hypothetical protein